MGGWVDCYLRLEKRLRLGNGLRDDAFHHRHVLLTRTDFDLERVGGCVGGWVIGG